jgi:hypothetical protein
MPLPGEEQRELRGECPLCGQGVYSDEDRTKDSEGVYYHEACFEVGGDRGTLKGECAVCLKGVFSSQERTADPDGNYFHTKCFGEIEARIDDQQVVAESDC